MLIKLKKERVPRQQGDGIGWDLMGHYISQDAGIQNQTVSSGFTAMTLWRKPLCCLGCKLRVHTES